MKKRFRLILNTTILVIIVLTIYLQPKGNKYKIKSDINKTMAIYIKNDNDTYEKTTNIPTSGYTLNTEKSLCSNGTTPTWENNTLQLSNLSKSNTSCYLYFDKLEGITIPEIISGLNAKTETPDFSQVATTDEGVYATEDGMYGGTSYYWRGATTTNYVKFADFCWRIIRINGDGSIRLLYDGTACHTNGEATTENIAVLNTSYNTKYEKSEYVGWTYIEGKQRPEAGDIAIDSNAKISTENWYNTTIKDNPLFSSKIIEGKFCNDRDTALENTWTSVSSTTFNYNAHKRLYKYSSLSPSFSCPKEDEYTLKIGAITADEIVFAGGNRSANNNYYLYNGTNYWTMTPLQWYVDYSKSAYMFTVHAIGSLGGPGVHGEYGIRPVVNLRSDTIFKLGTNGTINNPYEVI